MKKLVVITGASSGFGKALALEFSKGGYPLLLLARRVELLEELNLANTICEKVDVTNYEAFEKSVRKAEELYGKTDLIINNAGVMFLGNIASQDPQQWQTMLDVNVMGVMNGMKIVMEDMKQRKCGTIVNIASIAGVKPFPLHAAYCATKYGVIGLSETARGELAEHNVRVIRICPGAVNTELLSHTTSDEIKANYKVWIETTGVGSITANDIAKTVKFAYEMPQGVNLREIQIADTRQDA
ncbi:SDR family oxidoreductase [Lentisphaerota bacterium WC36G]|nr:SDR family oxidoreductase [Lentisphaerae bacterium WC36]